SMRRRKTTDHTDTTDESHGQEKMKITTKYTSDQKSADTKKSNPFLFVLFVLFVVKILGFCL
ncbi:MAG: hypothetical protein LBQ44_00895, partial [Treponema sp.]|nr:hypothetical protein [Treponema sp.]